MPAARDPSQSVNPWPHHACAHDARRRAAGWSGRTETASGHAEKRLAQNALARGKTLGAHRTFLALLIAASVLTTAPATALAQEVQQHGLIFERWVRDTFFGGYTPASYTQRWDIPAQANQAHGGVPVNPKAVKFGTPVDLGDALRQYDINEPFLLVLGFWEQDGDEKRFVNILAPLITPRQWRSLWGDVTYADLLKLDALIKDAARPIGETRKLALQMKNAPPFTTAVIQVNPKIDARQRRLQCSLRFADVFKHLAPDAPPRPAAPVTLWGVPVPGPIHSPPRRP